MKKIQKYRFIVLILAVIMITFLYITSSMWYRLTLANFYERSGNRNALMSVYGKIYRKLEIKYNNPLKGVLTPKISKKIRYKLTKELSRFYLESGYKNKAIQCYSAMNEIDPNNIKDLLILNALTQKGATMAGIVLDKTDLPVGDRFYSEFLKTPLWQYNYGISLAKRKKYQEAKREFEQLTSEYPYLSTFHYCLRKVLDELGLKEEANKEYQIADKLNHGHLFKEKSDKFNLPFDFIATWKLEEGIGDIAKDGSGNFNHGHIKSAKWIDGISGTALYFDGIKDTVIIEDNDGLHLDGKDFTIAMWIQPALQKRYRFVYYKKGVNLDLYGNDVTWNFRLQTPQTGRRELKVDLPIEDGKWYFIVQRVQQGMQHKVWVYNKQSLIKTGEKSEDVTYGGSDGNALEFSHSGESGNFEFADSDARFKGSMDEIMIFNRALTDMEIQGLFQSFSK